MQFKLILILIISIASNNLNAQNEFEVSYSYTDERDVYFFAAEENNDGDFVVTGNLVSGSTWEGLIAKMSSQGEIIFFKELDLEVSSSMSDIALFEDNFIVVGTITNAQFNTQAFLGKYDYDGNLQFYETYGGFSFYEFKSITKTPDGNIIAVGSTTGNSDTRDAYIVKLDIQGNILWERFIDDENDAVTNTARPIILDDQSIIVATNTDETDKGIVSKIDMEGNLIWEKVYEDNDGYLITSVVKDESNNIILAGWYRTFPNYNAFLIKIDDSGNQIWQNSYDYPTTGNDRFSSILQGTDGNYFVAGNTEEIAYLSKIDTSGNVISHNEFGGDESDYFHHISTTSDSKLLISGYTRSFNDLQKLEGYLIKVGNDGVVPIHNLEFALENIKCFPNPTNKIINFEIPHDVLGQKLDIEIYTVGGKTIHLEQKVFYDDNQYILNNLSPGSYFINVKTKNKIYRSKFIIVEE